MLQIKNVTKNYTVTKELTVRALKGVSLNFRKSEFVSILGPSGCGKTTLLNVIGGLDRYDEGDVVINGVSTKSFSDADWDTYRNHSIGFVFQSYNLIPNMSVLDNVALALSVAGEGISARIKKAKEALLRVGLAAEMRKYPNQLSGGQMQRVAIARAIVNNPDVILADEPTGALDSETGIQVMELLKEISADRLVIMVTHNRELADEYSTRIVNMVDGNLLSDSNPYTEEEVQTAEQNSTKAQQECAASGYAEAIPAPKIKTRRSRMSIFTAFGISLRNLKKKIGRTFLVSFAGSIGIFGIALVLAISVGMGNYVDYMQTEAVGDTAITLGETTAYSLSRILSVMEDASGGGVEQYPDIQAVDPYQRESFSAKSSLTENFIKYIQDIDQSWIKAMNYTYSVQMHVLEKTGENSYALRSNWANYAHQMIEEDELIEDNYDVLFKSQSSATGYPADYTEVSLVVDKFNRITPSTLTSIGIPLSRNEQGAYNLVPFTDIVDREYELVLNDGWYTRQENGTFKAATGNFGSIAEEHKVKIKIVSILRVKNNKATNWLSSGIAYLPELSEFLVNDARDSAVGQAQFEATDHNVLTGAAFTRPQFGTEEEKDGVVLTAYMNALKNIGAYTVPTSIMIYPKSIDAKKNINEYVNTWNLEHPEEEVLYMDITELAISLLSTFIDVVTYVLIGFSAVALLVSTVMISVITYTSVVERVKEIGILRSIGARKPDISNLFNTETLLVGTFAGTMGVVFALLVGFLGNKVIALILGVTGIIQFSWGIVLGMLALSIGLTLLAGLIPAIIAARKDPVTCLRTE